MDPTGRFVACLRQGGIEAITEKFAPPAIDVADTVFVRSPNYHDHSTGFQPRPHVAFAGGGFGMWIDGRIPGAYFVAVESGADLYESPEMMAVYQACEVQVPEFEQPERVGPDHPLWIAMEQAERDDAMEFAQCARDGGFLDIADPRSEGAPAILIPPLMEPEIFRAALNLCWQESYNFMWSAGSTMSENDQANLNILQEFWARQS
jgi:hypothetical protein